MFPVTNDTDSGYEVSRRRAVRGTSTLEVVVAFTLLSGVIGIAGPLVVRHGRLLTQYHDYQQALEELSNQMERLFGLPAEELAPAVGQLAPSPMAAAELPGAELHGELAPDEIGMRLTLRLAWDEPGRREKPVCLTAWVFPRTTAVAGPTPGSQP